MMLYPLKFRVELLPKVWGGHTIAQWYDNLPADIDNVGEAWVLSDYDTHPTEVANGSHAGDSLRDLIEVYMDELVGGKIYDAFGNHFPLLMKFIDAADDLSIQVHPDDDYALEHDDSLGKTEMWYIMPSPEDASIYLGWNQDTNPALVREAIQDGSLARYMRDYKVHAGDAALIPAGTVHAMRKNTILAEIQENSDANYRLYDYNRLGDDGKLRPLHIEKSLDVLNYAAKQNAVRHPEPVMNGAVNVEDTDFFTVNLMALNKAVQRDYAPLDSFVAFMCIDGACTITALDCESEDKTVSVRKGEAVLIPACLNDIVLTPQPDTQLLEIYIR